MTKSNDTGSYLFAFTILIIVSFYYCFRWYENSQNTQGFLIEKCWLAREIRAADNDIIYLDGENFHSRKVIQHGEGAYSGFYGENNATETVYMGNNGTLISLYDYQLQSKKEIEKLGLKFFGYKIYLPCSGIEDQETW